MKRIAFTIALVLSLGLNNIWAEGNGVNNTNSGVRTIKSPRFARPLVEKWIEEYAKTEPGVVFQIVKGSANQDNIDLNIVLVIKNLAILFISERRPCCLLLHVALRQHACSKENT